MKIAVSGKGGVGKTLVVAFLSTAFARMGRAVLAVDADPNINLAAALGVPNPEGLIPLSKMDDLIEERTGARPGRRTPFFKMNPKVDDLPDKYALRHDGIRIMVMGPIKAAGTGCYCPEGALLQALISHLLLKSGDVVILDMEAGIEHLARGTARGVDKLLIVVEPTQRSVMTAKRVRDLAHDIGIEDIGAVANKVRSPKQREFLAAEMSEFEFLGFLPYDERVADADLSGSPLVDSSPEIMGEISKMAARLEAGVQSKRV